VARVELTGWIGRPLLTLHGTLDTLLPPATDSDVYARLVWEQGRSKLHRYYLVDRGNHIDGLAAFPDQLRPMLPSYRAAFEQLVGWVEHGTPPPPNLPRS